MSTGPSPHSAPTKRVRVTSSRRTAGRVTVTPLARDLDEQTGLGDVYLEGLMRAQFRLSMLVIVLTLLGIGGPPVLLGAIPATRSLTLAGIPFPWIVLGALVYPVAWAIAQWYTRQAERIERDFRDVMAPE